MNSGSLAWKVLVWALCVSQGLVYIVSTPLWEGWDEAFHYAYVQGLVENRTLPVFGQSILSKEMTSSFAYAPVSYGANLNLDSKYTTHEDYWKLPRDERQSRETRLRSIPNGERRLRPEPGLQFQNYEAHQAPLYYILAAPIYSLFSSSGLLARVWMLRLFSLLVGSLTIPIAFSTVRYAGSGRHLTVIPLLLALLPLLYPTIGRIANDSVAVPLYSALVLLTLRYFARSCTMFDALALGAVLGLGLLTKAYFLTALPALALTFLLAVLFDPYAKYPRRRLLAHAGVIAALAFAIAGPWYIRNYVLYDNISGMQEVTRTASFSLLDRIEGISRVEWGSSLRSMLKQHIWIGNTSLLSLSRALYQVGYALIFLGILGAVRSVIDWVRLPKADKLTSGRNQSIVILGIFYVFFVLGVLYHMLTNYMLLGVPDGTGGWYLYALIVAELILLVRGLEALVGARAAGWSNAVLVVYVLVANLVSLLCKTLPFYAGIFIPRFHLSHFFELYSPSGFRAMLANLAINKPGFVTPVVIAVVIGFSLVLLGLTLVYAWKKEQEF